MVCFVLDGALKGVIMYSNISRSNGFACKQLSMAKGVCPIHHGFTLVELITVIGIISVLVALLLGSVHSSLSRAKGAACISGMRQLHVAYQMYLDDNKGVLPSNNSALVSDVWRSVSNSWCGFSSALNDQSSENFERGALFGYLRTARILRCPSDHSLTMGERRVPRTRSVSLHGVLAGRSNDIQTLVFSIDKIPDPSGMLAFIDESDRTIDDGHFLVYPPPSFQLVNVPAFRHSRGVTYSKLDGAVMIRKMANPIADLQEMSLSKGQRVGGYE